MSERWEIDWEGNRILAKDERKSIICHMGGNLRNPEVAKDAYLIAASGDLLEALEEVSRVLTMEEHLNPNYGWGDFIAKHISPALKKAKP